MCTYTRPTTPSQCAHILALLHRVNVRILDPITPSQYESVIERFEEYVAIVPPIFYLFPFLSHVPKPLTPIKSTLFNP